MNMLTLFDALTMINEGRAQETVDQLREMRLHSPSDILTNYVLGHALDVCNQHSRANSIWETASSLCSEDRVIKKMKLPDGVSVFTHTDRFQSGLSEILGEDESDEIQNLIQQLDSSERTNFEVALDDDNESFGGLTDDDPITETYARILATQKKYSQAAAVYRSLSEQNPDEKDRLLDEAKKLDHLANSETGT